MGSDNSSNPAVEQPPELTIIGLSHPPSPRMVCVKEGRDVNLFQVAKLLEANRHWRAGWMLAIAIFRCPLTENFVSLSGVPDILIVGDVGNQHACG